MAGDKLSCLLIGVKSLEDLKSLLVKSTFAVGCDYNCAFCGTELSGSDEFSHEVVQSLLRGLPQSDDVRVTLLECRACNKYRAIWFNGQWHAFEDFLRISGYCQTEFSQVTRPVDHLIIFILSQVYHNCEDIDLLAGESPFLPPFPSDLSVIMWKDNHAIGFYTIKQKGTAFPGYPISKYMLNVIDAIYVRRSWRHLGFASRAISEVVSMYPDQDIGFSDPVSQSLLAVLHRYLSAFPRMRDHMWVCSFTGEPGYRWNVYLRMKMEKQRAKRVQQ